MSNLGLWPTCIYQFLFCPEQLSACRGFIGVDWHHPLIFQSSNFLSSILMLEILLMILLDPVCYSLGLWPHFLNVHYNIIAVLVLSGAIICMNVCVCVFFSGCISWWSLLQWVLWQGLHETDKHHELWWLAVSKKLLWLFNIRWPPHQSSILFFFVFCWLC